MRCAPECLHKLRKIARRAQFVLVRTRRVGRTRRRVGCARRVGRTRRVGCAQSRTRSQSRTLSQRALDALAECECAGRARRVRWTRSQGIWMPLASKHDVRASCTPTPHHTTPPCHTVPHCATLCHTTPHHTAPHHGCRFQITLQISKFKIQISGFKFQVSNFRFQISEFRIQISDFRFQISDFRFQNSTVMTDHLKSNPRSEIRFHISKT